VLEIGRCFVTQAFWLRGDSWDWPVGGLQNSGRLSSLANMLRQSKLLSRTLRTVSRAVVAGAVAANFTTGVASFEADRINPGVDEESRPDQTSSIMATHQCTRCLRKTVEEADSVEPPLVVSFSICPHPDPYGGGHVWVPIHSPGNAIIAWIHPLIHSNSVF
jgi:hypothetical protein